MLHSDIQWYVLKIWPFIPQDHHNQFPRDLSVRHKKVVVNFSKLLNQNISFSSSPPFTNPSCNFMPSKGLHYSQVKPTLTNKAKQNIAMLIRVISGHLLCYSLMEAHWPPICSLNIARRLMPYNLGMYHFL